MRSSAPRCEPPCPCLCSYALPSLALLLLPETAGRLCPGVAVLRGQTGEVSRSSNGGSGGVVIVGRALNSAGRRAVSMRRQPNTRRLRELAKGRKLGTSGVRVWPRKE